MTENQRAVEDESVLREQYGEFFEEKYNHALAYCRRILKDEELAYDAVQTGYANLWEKKALPKEHKRRDGYFFATLHNVCVDIIKKRDHSDEDVLIPSQTGILEQLVQAEMLAERLNNLAERLNNLTAIEQQAIRLWGDGFGGKEVAKKLKIKENTAYQRIHSAKVKLGMNDDK